MGSEPSTAGPASSADRGHPADAGAGEFRAAGHAAIDLLADYLARLPDGPVFRPMPEAARQRIAGLELPDEARPLGALLDGCRDDLMAYPMGNGHPRFLGWVNSPPEVAGIVGALVGAAIDPSCAGGDHAATYLEQATVRWLADLVGYPLDAGIGLLTSGGSMAALVGLAAARHRAALDDGWSVRDDGLQGGGHAPLVLYVSSETHSSVGKAAEILGIGRRRVRSIQADARGRLDPDQVGRAVRDDRARGLRPFCVVGSAGTTATGAIDPLDGLADVAAAERLWLHVDGAYGALGVLDRRLAPAFAGMARADSLALDPHKWLRVPVDCGCVLVRDAAVVRDALSLVPAYLRTEQGHGFGGPPWFAEYSVEQTRPYRALRLWMTLAHVGRSGIVASVERCVDLARGLGSLVERSDDLELLAPVGTSVVVFRPRATSALPEAELAAHVRALVHGVQEAGRCFVTGAIVGGREGVRACFLNPATTDDDLQVVVDEVRRVSAQLRSASRPASSGPA